MEVSNNTIGIVLAAGMGKRMQSNLPKVAHLLLGKPLLIWAIEALVAAKVTEIVVVIAPTQQLLREIIAQTSFPAHVQIKFAYQNVPLGTGHAVQCAMQSVKNFFEAQECEFNVLITYGDTPAVRGNTFENFLNFHAKNNNVMTILAFQAKNPFGYGRIITDKNAHFIAIREEKDCSELEKKETLCNSGILCANFTKLEKILPQLKNENASKEYYLTDVTFLAKQCGNKIGYMVGNKESEFAGVNSQEQLLEMERMLGERS